MSVNDFVAGFNERPQQEWQQPIPLNNKQLPLFDTSIFPTWLKEYVDTVAEETQTPKDAAAMVCISILSTILGGKYAVKPNDTSWVEILSTFIVIALDPANRKSAVFSLFQKPISEFEKNKREELAPKIAEEKAERSAVQKRINKLEDKYSKENDTQKAEAILNEIKSLQKELDEKLKLRTRPPRFFTSDATQEVLAQLMYENDGRFSILSSEGQELFDMVAGRYSGKYNLDIYLKAYSGDNVTIDRKNSPSILLENPALTIGLFVQPSVIQELPNNFSNRGLTQRFLFCLPKSKIGSRKVEPIPIPEAIKYEFQSNIKKLLELSVSNQPTDDSDTFELELDGQILLRFDNEAKKHLLNIMQEVEIMLGNPDLNVALKGWIGKLVGQIIRIAGILHISEYVKGKSIPFEINKDTLMKADSLRDYFIQHAEAAFGIIGENENLDDVKYVLGKITSKKFEGKSQIDYQEIWQLVKKRFKRSELLKDILDFLEEMNYIKNGLEGKKRIILINPSLQKSSPNYPKIEEKQSYQHLELREENPLEVPYPLNLVPNENQLGEQLRDLVTVRENSIPSEKSTQINIPEVLGELGKENERNILEDGSELI